ncbi:LuxR C-terminal-related transcriptional regulator [Phaeacidiphilus oryzae]|uniref:LuxR C-terminal-related transcriptional regulator n=1 Tax=Phaeacidiphilus oryzae TaxID=348818 RepID=UPI000A073681|nr:LuxR C-terminal-related transcriptional regulator [Phaeacidiphilus oryzae]
MRFAIYARIVRSPRSTAPPPDRPHPDRRPHARDRRRARARPRARRTGPPLPRREPRPLPGLGPGRATALPAEPDAAGQPPAEGLTEQEHLLLVLLCRGLPEEAIARRLLTSSRTVRRRIRALCDRLGVRTPLQAAVWAARRGLI